MKPRLSTAMGQHLVLTPQLRQAIRLLQLSTTELEAELAEAVASNPLLDWCEPSQASAPIPHDGSSEVATQEGDGGETAAPEEFWDQDAAPWQERIGPWNDNDQDETEQHAGEPETLHDHLLWQLHLGHLSPTDRQIGVAIIDAIDDDGYLREPLEAIVASLDPELDVDLAEAATVLHQIQRFDPVGVGAIDLGDCLRLQLQVLPADTPGLALAMRATDGTLQKLPKIGIDGMARALDCSVAQAEQAVQLLRSLDPRPGAQYGGINESDYVVPDCVIWRQQGLWRVALAQNSQPRVMIHRGYQRMIGRAGEDEAWLRSRLQEARWLIKGLEARATTLLRVMRHLVREQAAFLDLGPAALRPLTLRHVATALDMHESTVSRAIARKYVRTPRGTLALRAFFASGIEGEAGGGTSSIAIQDMIRRLVQEEDPRRPLSDARLAELLKRSGVPVARRTVAKYREAIGISASHDRVRLG